MNYTYIFCACNDKKERASISMVFSFNTDEDDKILSFINKHKERFFDGNYSQRERSYRELFKQSIDKNIIDAINSNLNIYAMVQAIPQIANS